MRNNLAILPKDSADTRQKDGDDGGRTVDTYVIECALDGFMVTINYDDGHVEKYVRQELEEVISIMRGC